MTTDKMLAEKRGAIGVMTFNNVARHNAVSLEMWDAAEAILADFMADEAIRVIVLTGAGGKAFVSGADISKFESERSEAEAVTYYNTRTKAVYEGIANLGKPTVAMINGYCIGGGLALSLCCDVRICSPKSRFGLPAARLGLGYPFQRVKQLIDTVGPGAAKDIIFSARRITAEDAQRIGLVQQIVEEEALENHVMEYAGQIAQNAPLTVAALKFAAIQAFKDPDTRELDKVQEMVDACFASEDYIEGRRAFMEKRPTAFKGR